VVEDPSADLQLTVVAIGRRASACGKTLGCGRVYQSAAREFRLTTGSCEATARVPCHLEFVLFLCTKGVARWLVAPRMVRATFRDRKPTGARLHCGANCCCRRDRAVIDTRLPTRPRYAIAAALRDRAVNLSRPKCRYLR